MKNLYQKLDNAVMSSANAAVKAWNWTTGRTKSDLASILAYCFPLALCTASAIDYREDPNSNLGTTGLVIGTWGLYSLARSRTYRKIENEESKLADKGLKSVWVEEEKEGGKIQGAITLTMSPIVLMTKEGTHLDEVIGAVGVVAIAFSNYVIRTEYLPPRKDCIRRGIDNLIKMHERDSKEPSVVSN